MNSYLYLKVDGKSINKFLLKCNRNNINILNIRYLSYKSVVILINKDDYNKIKKIKGAVKVKVVGSEGIVKYKSLVNKYKYLLISFLLGILLLIFLSNIIFSVEVIGDNNSLNLEIKKELSNYNIEKYKFKKSYKYIEEVKKKIKNKYKDNIEWIEIKENGVKYIVNFVERKVSKEEENSEIYSIVSTKSGVIKDIYSESGISLVDIGNYVNKGDILISSDIILNEEVKNRVNAKGKVYAETWYKAKVEYPLNYKEIKYTSRKRKILYFKIGNKYFELFKYKNFDRKNIISYKDKITGISFGLEEIRETIVINKKYNNKKALNKAIKEAKNKINLKLNEDEYIINEKTLNFYNNGSKIIVDIFFSVYEEIGEEKVIEMGEENDTENIGERVQ